MNSPALSAFIWSVADLLRGDYKQSEYGKVILPFTVLRCLDCVLEPIKAKVLAEYAKKTAAGINLQPDLLSFAAITDEPEADVAAAGHGRTIINLKSEYVDAWLNSDPAELDDLGAMFGT